MLTSFDGGRLFGQVHGSGAPRVLALHGWQRTHRDFDAVLGGEQVGNGTVNSAVVQAPHAVGTADEAQGPTPLQAARSASDTPLPADTVPSIALDLPGFGGAPAPESPWGSAEYATAVAAVLEEMGRPVVVIGHSFGGRIAVHLAAEHPDQVLGLLLTGAPLFSASSGNGAGRRQRPPARYRIARALARSGMLGERKLEEMKQRYGSADYRAASGVMRDVLVRAIAEEREEAYTASLEAITCPTALVWGELDTAAPPAVAERITSAIGPSAHLDVEPGIGHLTPLLIPGRLRASVDRLLAGST